MKELFDALTAWEILAMAVILALLAVAFSKPKADLSQYDDATDF